MHTPLTHPKPLHSQHFISEDKPASLSQHWVGVSGLRGFANTVLVSFPYPPISHTSGLRMRVMWTLAGIEARCKVLLVSLKRQQDVRTKFPFLAFQDEKIERLNRSFGWGLDFRRKARPCHEGFSQIQDRREGGFSFDPSDMLNRKVMVFSVKAPGKGLNRFGQKAPILESFRKGLESPREKWYTLISQKLAADLGKRIQYYLKECLEWYGFRSENVYIRLNLFYDRSGRPMVLCPGSYPVCSKRREVQLNYLTKKKP